MPNSHTAASSSTGPTRYVSPRRRSWASKAPWVAFSLLWAGSPQAYTASAEYSFALAQPGPLTLSLTLTGSFDQSVDFSYLLGSGPLVNIVLMVEARRYSAPVPELSEWALMLAGLCVLATWARTKHRPDRRSSSAYGLGARRI